MKQKLLKNVYVLSYYFYLSFRPMLYIKTLIPLIILSFTCSAQTKVYYYRGIGIDTLTVYANKKFKCSGSIELARSITYEGKIMQKNDTLLFIQTTPTIINKLDTINLNSYKTIPIDTFIIIDDKTLINITDNNESYYKLIQEYEGNTLIRELKWTYKDTLINSKLINNFPIEIK